MSNLTSLKSLLFANLYSKVWVAESSHEPGPDGYLLGETSFDTPCTILISTPRNAIVIKHIESDWTYEDNVVLSIWSMIFFRCLAMCWWMLDSSEPFKNCKVSIVMICQGESWKCETQELRSVTFATWNFILQVGHTGRTASLSVWSNGTLPGEELTQAGSEVHFVQRWLSLLSTSFHNPETLHMPIYPISYVNIQIHLKCVCNFQVKNCRWLSLKAMRCSSLLPRSAEKL